MKYKNVLIEMAHEQMVQSIYETSKIEGVPFTFPQTRDIITNEQKSSSKYSNYPIEFDIVIRLKRAYQMCLRIANDDTQYVSLDNILSINDTLGQYHYVSYGVLRNTQPTVAYGKHKYNPPEESDKKRQEWKKYLSQVKFTCDEIIEQFLYIIKEQCFNDTNKRTAIIITNILLLKRQIGFLRLNLDKIDLFSKCIFEYDHSKISITKAIDIIKNNFIVVNTRDTRKNILNLNDTSTNKRIIEKALENKNLTKYKLAMMLNTDNAHISRILSFTKKPSVELAKKIALVLEID
jgi:hypothetical protein